MTKILTFLFLLGTNAGYGQALCDEYNPLPEIPCQSSLSPADFRPSGQLLLEGMQIGGKRFFTASGDGTNSIIKAGQQITSCSTAVGGFMIKGVSTDFGEILPWAPEKSMEITDMARPFAQNLSPHIYRVIHAVGHTGPNAPNWDLNAAGEFEEMLPSGKVGVLWRLVGVTGAIPQWTPGSTIYSGELRRGSNPAWGVFMARWVYPDNISGTTATDVANEPDWENWETWPEHAFDHDGTVKWQHYDNIVPANGAWTASSVVEPHTQITPTSGAVSIPTPVPIPDDAPFLVYRAVGVSGATGSSEPNWPTHDQPFTDGDVTWIHAGVNSADVDFRADYKIYLKDGFKAEKGCHFHAYISPKWNEVAANSDNFDNLDLTKWRFDPDENCFVEIGDQDKNVRVSNSVLEIACALNKKNQVRGGGLISNDPAGPYGRWDFRASLPMSESFYSALWLDNFPITEEIDVMEATWNQECDDRTHHTYHAWHGTGNKLANGQDGLSAGVNLNSPTGYINNQFRTYSVEWTERELRWLVDGRVVFRLPEVHRRNVVQDMFKIPLQAKISLHNQGALPLPADVQANRMLVDWMRYSTVDPSSIPSRKKLEPVEKLNAHSSSRLEFTVTPSVPTERSVMISVNSIPRGASARVNVYDVLGNHHGTVFEGPVETGELKKWYSISSSLPAGMYYFVLRVDDTIAEQVRVETRKVNLLR